MTDTVHTKRVAPHTRGPWAVEDPMEHELSIVEAGKPSYEWKFIACVPYGGLNDGDFSRPVAEANARLIAAAPELLAALQLIVDTYGFDSSTDSAIWKTAHAALAKATGHSSDDEVTHGS